MRFSFAVFSFLGSASAFCHHSTFLDTRATSADYTYLGVTGPLNWHHLDAAYDTCASGKYQSPIALSTSSAVSGSKVLRFKGSPHDHETLENLGHTLEVSTPNATLVTAGKDGLKGKDAVDHQLIQIHFHTPSEHFVDEINSAMEMHMVFENPGVSTLTVVGILIDIASESHKPSPFLEDVFVNAANAPHVGDHVETNKLDYSEISSILKKSVMQYGGSLTTPPCTEGVSWNVASEKLYLSQATYNLVKSIIKYNSRFIQNVSGGENLLKIASVPGVPKKTGETCGRK